MASRLTGMLLARFWTTDDFRRHFSDAEIMCAHCRRRVILKPCDIERMFPDPVPVDRASRRFRCTRCSGRGAAISALVRRR
jgi:DNA-directed RNA polymerase subunit RPC12/RpoP